MSATTADATAPTAGRSTLQLALLSITGTSIEWYDFFLYGIGAALVFPTMFFPADLAHPVALALSFLTFAAGFIARPVGGLLFGHMGDRIGRKSALAAALVLMGVATTLIACLPSYAAAGPIAPLLLVLLRVAQGLAIGGQWGGAVLLVLENAPPERRGLLGSVPQMGVPVGVILANVAFLAAGAVTSDDEFLAWGWRLPFLVSVLLIWLGLYVHHRVAETRVFQGTSTDAPVTRDAPARSPVLEVIRAQPRAILLATLTHLAANLCFYINLTYVMAYGTDPAGNHLPRNTMLTVVLIGSLFSAPAILAAGWLSDRYGRRRICMLGAAGMVPTSFLLFPLIDTRSLPLMALGSVLLSIPSSLLYGPIAALFGELFPTTRRYSGMSFSYQAAAIFGGAFAPLIATALMARFESTLAISTYMSVACILAYLAVRSLHETRGSSLSDHALHRR